VRVAVSIGALKTIPCREVIKMDKQTADYRQSQFALIIPYESEFEPSVKFIGPNGQQTYWMDITEQELEAIRRILTGEDAQKEQ